MKCREITVSINRKYGDNKYGSYGGEIGGTWTLEDGDSEKECFEKAWLRCYAILKPRIRPMDGLLDPLIEPPPPNGKPAGGDSTAKTAAPLPEPLKGPPCLRCGKDGVYAVSTEGGQAAWRCKHCTAQFREDLSEIPRISDGDKPAETRHRELDAEHAAITQDKSTWPEIT